MKRLITQYRPRTATPFSFNATHSEYAANYFLQPYIICFWGSEQPYRPDAVAEQSTSLVVPDTAMDIIFIINYSSGKVFTSFHGINDHAYYVPPMSGNDEVAVFAVRFYFWTVGLFTRVPLDKVLNYNFDAREYFADFVEALTPHLIEERLMGRKILFAEQLLSKQISFQEIDSHVFNALYLMLKTNKSSQEIFDSVYLSRRQLERLFLQYTGVTPKKAYDLIRYQRIWQTMLGEEIVNAQDLVFRFGFVDQAHLLKSFKKFHGLTPRAAKNLALNKK
ncbi:AraC family transcriptional regulator [Culicoidibacter larvae]|uniref:Helix-turn-helix domain-containing protein n=1 Tax=Culicoidibacter larvae TaxID=2579976 RepID=A0A5R8QEY0_9FIRM|nr:helix-turn-helix domain-containing protein [Culicoidibacter larvae]TLG76558.1 helix-turn-helix domain-containing protein [Culicoidibacter larvae]